MAIIGLRAEVLHHIVHRRNVGSSAVGVEFHVKHISFRQQPDTVDIGCGNAGYQIVVIVIEAQLCVILLHHCLIDVLGSGAEHYLVVLEHEEIVLSNNSYAACNQCHSHQYLW